MPPAGKIYGSRLQHLSNAATILTGLAYGWFKYSPASSDPYSRASSPLEPLTHDFHIVVVPLLVFACGLIWQSHIVPKWRAVLARRPGLSKTFSGLGLLFVLIPMIATGYLIQVSVDDAWRKAWVIVHLGTSAVWTASYLMHLIWKA